MTKREKHLDSLADSLVLALKSAKVSFARQDGALIERLYKTRGKAVSNVLVSFKINYIYKETNAVKRKNLLKIVDDCIRLASAEKFMKLHDRLLDLEKEYLICR